MKSRKDRSAQRRRKQDEVRAEADEARTAKGEFGPADPMPDGRKRVPCYDAISRLKATGKLPPELERASNEILEVFKARVSGLLVKSQQFERVDQSINELEAEWLLAASQRYDRWATWAQERKAVTGINVHRLILDVFMDGWTLVQCDRRLRRRDGTAKLEIQKGLVAYALLSKWISRQITPVDTGHETPKIQALN